MTRVREASIRRTVDFERMRHDPLGFPIPPEFDVPDAGDTGRPSARPAGRGAAPARGKRLVVLGLLAAVLGPGIGVPVVLPVVREVVVRWSIARAYDSEARGRPTAAVGEVGRALAWSGGDAALAADLLCWRAMLRLDARDAPGAATDAARAIELAPTAARPLRVRALVNVVRGRPDEALRDAETAVTLAHDDDPEALNHRAYIRALVRRDLPAALADVETALAGDDAPAPEVLDTRGFLLHLVGRHHEAIDELNLAIAGAEAERRDALAKVHEDNRVEIARALRALDRGLAVMHHHRGLACRAAGLDNQAEQDLAIAERKGYDPSRGVM
ncbi:MAG: tetratricopeptide repeat protein [Planctomycetaceae bacterium]